ncbi:ATP-binding protein [Streptomyces sp. NPDC050636]|uniref:ATP-binding protein n=1 Tax=Streptomyces sp. NPDC050636 TaxID=3154510 RepID=UPI0034351C12
MRVGPGAVLSARQEVTARLTEFGIDPKSSLADAAQLVVSELVANVLRHAADRSPTADVGVAVAAGQLVIAVTDRESRVPDAATGPPGAGLRVVADLVDEYDGTLSVEPVRAGHGKTILARFVIPDADVW